MAGIHDAGGSVQTALGAPVWMGDLFGERWFLNAIHVDLSECDQPDEYVAHLARLPVVETLIIAGDRFSDEHAKTLHRKSTLRWLILDSTSVSKSELDALKSALPNTTVYRSYRKDIAWLRSSKSRFFRGNPVSMYPMSIETKYNCPEALAGELDEDFFEEPVAFTDEWMFSLLDLKRIGRFETLERLSVRLSVLSREGLLPLAELSNLRSLNILNASADDRDALTPLAKLSRLESLSLRGADLVGVDLAWTHALRSLTSLDLRASNITATELVALHGLATLEQLDLRETGAGLAELIALQRTLPRLRELLADGITLNGNGRVTLVGTRWMEPTGTEIQFLNTLRSVNLSCHTFAVTDATLKNLTSVKNVETLDVGFSKITDAGLVHLQSFAKLKNLRLYDTEISDAGLAHLRSLSSLETLDLNGTKISDAGLAQLAALTRLRKLSIRGTRISAAGIARFRIAVPKCDVQR